MKTTTRALGLALSWLLLAGGMVACWDDAEQIDQVTWSDDNAGQAYVKLLFEESGTHSPLSDTTNKRNFRHRLYVQNPDGSFRALTGERPGQNGADFYYMRQAGYVLIDVIEDGHSRRFDLIRLSNGLSQTVARFTRPDGPAIPCQHGEVLPSPDGQTIALIERNPVAGGGGTPEACANGNTTVTFFAASTLTQTARHEWPMHAMPEVVWSEENELYVWGYEDGSWRVDPAAGPIPAEHPRCTWPRTSSSALSYGGVLIGPGEDDSNPVVVVATEQEMCRGPE